MSTIKKESIRVLGKNHQGEYVAEMPLARSYGEISSDVLQSIMLVDPQPPIKVKKDLDELTELVDQGLYYSEKALKLNCQKTNQSRERGLGKVFCNAL